ncbi:MAG: molybdopterin molybdotransferase MoeA [Armatimonadaceae bacterium]
MLSYDQALARILAAAPTPTEPARSIPANLATHSPWVLAKPLVAEQDLPPFDNSMVDGFAVRLADTRNAAEDSPISLTIVETIPAGYWSRRFIETGQAARILTGAPVPQGADAIVMQEDTETRGEKVLIKTPASSKFIRRKGSDIRQGEVAIPAGMVIHPGEAALIAALRPETVSVLWRKPQVAIVTTGDEVLPWRRTDSTPALQPGQIYDANGPALFRAVEDSGGNPNHPVHVRDDVKETRQALQSILNNSPDVIIASGGVSVGERDYVREVVSELGELDFWRVAVKPGKPLAFGKIGSTLFFGLPGNPVSSLVTFELFVRPVLRKLAGYTELTRPQVNAILTTNLPHEPGRREFVRAKLHWQDDTYHATPTGAQGSHRLASMVGANALLIAHEDHSDYSAGESLPALLLT